MAKIEPHHLDGLAALAAAQSTKLRQRKDERDTAFVKRIVCAYLNAHNDLQSADDFVAQIEMCMTQ